MISMWSIKAILFAFFIFFILGLSGGGSKELKPKLLSGEIYWVNRAIEIAFDRDEEILRNVKKNADGTLSGEIQSRGVHSSEFVPFISQVKEIEDPEEKKKGFIRACNGFALFMNNASSPEGKGIWREALKKFTGREFQTKKQWDEWLKANEKFLKFSEESGRLEVVIPIGKN